LREKTVWVHILGNNPVLTDLVPVYTEPKIPMELSRAYTLGGDPLFPRVPSFRNKEEQRKDDPGSKKKHLNGHPGKLAPLEKYTTHKQKLKN
jgi:hypothetical protein